ncbi:MAG TPA: erythromycin esterase family protein, partial [Kofleriaceae bacterium]|nr:erythromycin esterase family protein [Kofleriaceae bacterium]
MPDHLLARAIAETATPLRDDSDLDAVIDGIGDARFVLLGEATHGSREFYQLRAAVTRRLIVEKGFGAIAAEADWPDADRANRYIRHTGSDANVIDALADFQRFPQWMWRNDEIVKLMTWLRAVNDVRPPSRRVGFYGLDMYSLHGSIEAVLRYLDRADPKAAARARERYACFDGLGARPELYAQATAMGLTPDCANDVLAQLVDLQRRRASGDVDAFVAEQNARVVKNAEAYYRNMHVRGVSTWNLRDTHMMDTLDE